MSNGSSVLILRRVFFNFNLNTYLYYFCVRKKSIDCQSAVALIGFILFIDILRVSDDSYSSLFFVVKGFLHQFYGNEVIITIID